MIALINRYRVVIVLVFILVAIFILFIKPVIYKNDPQTNEQQPNELKIIQTKPDPLEGATILPTQEIEITLNKSIVKSEFKYRFDPEETAHEVELVDSDSSSMGKVFKIKFTKPLQLGSGYTLFILPSTHTEDKINLDREYIYHFGTIEYRGV